MTRILIFLSFVILLLAALPSIGNSLAEDTLNSKIAILQENGIKVSQSDIQSDYFTTKKRYEFLLQDAKKFLEYLEKYSDKQLPPYTDAMIDGVVIGADLEYSNFPFSKAVAVDVYPLRLSTLMIEEMKNEDEEFYKYIDKFLQAKGVLYHINYNIISQDFDGYLKDIKESYTLKDSTRISLELSNALYSGKGDLIAPTELISSVEKIILNIASDELTLNFALNGFSGSSNFESQSTYLTSAQLKNLKLLVSGMADNVTLESTDINVNVSSNTQGKKAQMFAKSSCKELTLKSKDLDFKSLGLNYDISLEGIDKDSLEEFRTLLTKAKNSSANDDFESEIRDSLFRVLSHGVTLNVADFSLNEVILNDKESLDGFSVVSTLVLREDKNLANKMSYFPIAIVQSIDTNVKIKISKKIFAKIVEMNSLLEIIKEYAKDEGSSLVFEITFNNGELRINGKALRI